MYKGQAKPIGSTQEMPKLRHDTSQKQADGSYKYIAGVDHVKLSTFVEETPTPMGHDIDVIQPQFGPGIKGILSSADQKIKDRNIKIIKGNKNEINNLKNKPDSYENNVRISKLKAEKTNYLVNFLVLHNQKQ